LVKVVSRTPTPASRTPSPENSPAAKTVDDDVAREQARAKAAAKIRTKQEQEALKISDVQIKAYWKRLESERKAPRVHQQGLSLHEKILRQFDISSQFGPCLGIARTNRWKRAEGLNLDPPIEVLAVLVKEELQGNTHMEKARVDELMWDHS